MKNDLFTKTPTTTADNSNLEKNKKGFLNVYLPFLTVVFISILQEYYTVETQEETKYEKRIWVDLNSNSTLLGIYNSIMPNRLSLND